MWSYGFYVILSWCGAFPPETARDVVFRCVHLFGQSCVVARAPAVKPGGSVDVKIRMPVTRTKKLIGSEHLNWNSCSKSSRYGIDRSQMTTHWICFLLFASTLPVAFQSTRDATHTCPRRSRHQTSLSTEHDHTVCLHSARTGATQTQIVRLPNMGLKSSDSLICDP